MENEKLVTLAVYDNAIEAHLLRTKLESQGITCFIFDENMVSLNPMSNVLLGGVKVKTFESQLEAAQELLSPANQNPLTNDDGTVIVCPRCHSTHIQEGVKSFASIPGVLWNILTIIFSIYPLYLERRYYCSDCKKIFKP